MAITGEPDGPPMKVGVALADVSAGKDATIAIPALTGVAPAGPGSVRLPPPRLDQHGVSVRALGWGAFDPL